MMANSQWQAPVSFVDNTGTSTVDSLCTMKLQARGGSDARRSRRSGYWVPVLGLPLASGLMLLLSLAG